ncbi:MAG: four helix bundle protein [Planctomycetes bacterium]|nr:four helix bundle protein [Planctomycetota bacterium]
MPTEASRSLLLGSSGGPEGPGELLAQTGIAERYALIDQLRRSSRSPCRSLREAWAKRRYEAHFVSKLTDADGENAETDTSLDMAHDCGTITDAEHAELTAECAEIGRMLGAMIQSPEKFLTSDF